MPNFMVVHKSPELSWKELEKKWRDLARVQDAIWVRTWFNKKEAIRYCEWMAPNAQTLEEIFSRYKVSWVSISEVEKTSPGSWRWEQSPLAADEFLSKIKKKEGAMPTSQSELFKGLKPQAVNEILSLGTEESLRKGTFVYKKGDPARFFYILKEGKLSLRIGEEGQIDYMVCDPGEAFGLSSLAGRETFATYAECIEECELLKIGVEQLSQLLERNPLSGLAFYRGLAGVLNQRLIKTHGMVLGAYKGAGPPSYG
jgi:hypothetical protein